MRVFRRGAGFLALAALILPVGHGARADELLVMPYSCAVIGGQPVLNPGPEQSHRIIGRRDQRKFSACSPVNPGMCRHWTVHRFDLDCDGARVSWVSVVAATNEGSRRAWLLDGRLVLRMGSRWSLAPDDPCAREPDPDSRFGYRRMRRHCADQLALAPPPVVEMPFGYAPMLGVDGIFVTASPGISAAPPPLPPVVAAPPPARAPGAKPPQPQIATAEPPPSQPGTPRELIAKGAPAKSAPAAPPQVATQQPQLPPKAMPVAPPAAAPVMDTPKTAPVETKPAAPAPKVAGPAPQVAAAAPPAPNDVARQTPPVPPADAAQPAAPPSKLAAEPQSEVFNINLLSAFRATTVGAIVAFGGLALGLLTAFALARRREHARDARRSPRDLAAVSLGSKRTKPPARIGDARGRLPPNAAASAMGRTPGRRAAAGAVADWGDHIPQNKAEAFQVLGIGVAPSANQVAIKKIVDGLRLSWHPDLAKDEADRALRELRSKQINAAWELLQGQRAEL